MEVQIDFLTDPNTGDLLVIIDADGNGDLAMGECRGQLMENMMRINPGEWPDDVTKGVGIGRYNKSKNNSATLNRLEKDMRLQLKLDDWTVNFLQINGLQDVEMDCDKN